MKLLSVPLTPEEAAVAEKRAASEGKTLDQFVSDYIHSFLRSGDLPPDSDPAMSSPDFCNSSLCSGGLSPVMAGATV